MKKQLRSSVSTFASIIFISTLFLMIPFANAQDSKTERLQNMPLEVIDDPYLPADNTQMQRTPAYSANAPTYFTRQVNVDVNGDNIVNDAANEPSIAVDPTNPNRIVIGWRQFDNINSNFRQAGNGYSLDGGQTWIYQQVLEPGVFRSDPVLDFDAEGNLYYNSLQNSFECDVYKITDGGQDWGAPFPAKGGDKQWMILDRSGGEGDGNNYSYWNSSFSTCNGQFTRSTDGSNTFEDCITIDEDPFWGTLAVDAEGSLYIAGTTFSGITIIKSTNAEIEGSNIVWDFSTPVNLDGDLNSGAPVNPQGLIGQTWVGTDNSNGSGSGNVYVLASVERFSNNDPADVMFAKSTDGGQSFLPPVRINTDANNSAYQWFGSMSVAPNGRIDVIWLDTRDAPAATNDSVLYYSFSSDQGESWSENLAISEPFNPNIGYPQQSKMGDYFHMTSDNEYAHLAWANTINGGQDVFYTRITPEEILATNDFSTVPFNFITYPNPFSEKTHIEFNLVSEEEVSVAVFDIQGKKVTTLFNGLVSGKKALDWDGTDNKGTKIANGLYFITISSAEKKYVSKIIRE